MPHPHEFNYVDADFTQVAEEGYNPLGGAAAKQQPVDEMLKPFYATALWQYLREFFAPLEKAFAVREAKLKARNVLIIALLFFVMVCDATMNVSGIMSESAYARKQRAKQATAREQLRGETETAGAVEAEQAVLAQLQKETQDLSDKYTAEVAAAETGKLTRGRERWYTVRQDTLAARAERSRQSIFKLRAARDVAATQRFDKEEHSQATGFEFYSALALGGLLPFVVGLLKYRKATLSHAVNLVDGQGLMRDYQSAWLDRSAIVGQLLAASFAKSFGDHVLAAVQWDLGAGFMLTFPGALIFFIVLVTFTQAYEHGFRIVLNTDNEKVMLQMRMRNAIEQHVDAAVSNVSAMGRIGAAVVNSEQAAAASRMSTEALRERIARDQAAFDENVRAAQRQESLLSRVPRAATPADLGRKLAEMKLSGALNEFLEAGITLAEMVKVNGFPKAAYTTVTGAMSRALNANKPQDAGGSDESEGELA